MATTTYAIKLTFATIYMRANLAEASSPIYVSCCDDSGGPSEDDWSATAYQTADARHREHEAAILAVISQGREWWCAPEDMSLDIDPDEYIGARIKSITEV